MARQLRYYQIEAKEAVERELKKGVINQLLVMATGCHAKGTPILMFDGSIKNVEDIVVGDKLMGNDNTERNVLQLARGREKMYRVIPVKGDIFVVNENHILSLQRTNVIERKKRLYPAILNISIKDYILLPNTWKHLYKLYRVPINFDQDLDTFTLPYLAGIWVADGEFDSPCIHKPDDDLWEEIKVLGELTYPDMQTKRVFPSAVSRCPYMTITYGHAGAGGPNPFLNAVRNYYQNGEKRIHKNVLLNTREVRLKFLAGLLDGDGYMQANGFEVSTKYKGLNDDILFLCRSLGFSAYSSYETKRIKSINFEGQYYRIYISGNTDEIPTVIKRKQASKRLQKKDHLRTGFSLEELDIDDFYGFALDGNHLYCMGDFTVTHNTGKTATAVDIIKNKGRVLWGTHTEDLLEQSAIDYVAEREDINKDELTILVSDHGGLIHILKTYSKSGIFSHPWLDRIIDTVGIIKAELFIIDKPIVFASMQTLWNRLNRVPSDYFDVVVCDECHLYLSRTFSLSVNHFKPKLRLGLTATPHRMDGMIMGDMFDEIIYNYPIEKGIADGYLCEIDAIRVKTESSLDNVKTLGGEFNQGQLEEVINTMARNELIVERYIKYCSGKQFIAFCVDVQHAIDLTEAFKNQGINTEFVVGDKELTTDRRGILSRFKQRELTGVSNVMILTAGFDHPNTGAILMCCPTKSLTKFLQQIGRGTRLKDEAYVAQFGQKVTVLDFIDVTSKHRLINTWTLDEGKEIEQRIFVTAEKKDKLIQARIERTFKANQQQKDIKIDLLKLPKVKISDSIRMQEPATEGQLAAIAKHGYDIVNDNYTKAMCSDIISNLPAYPSQVRELASAGYDVSKGVTFAEYKQAIKDIHERDAKANTERLKKEKKFPFKDL